MKISITKLDENAQVPTYAKDSDAGCDLRTMESHTLKPGERKLFKTGIAMAIPTGYVGLIWPRSGHAYKAGIDILGGVIDAGYRGDIGVILLNTGDTDFTVDAGDRIAQLLIQPIIQADFEEVPSLEESSRGTTGFGSSGKK